jgi:hypothetical protein
MPREDTGYKIQRQMLARGFRGAITTAGPGQKAAVVSTTNSAGGGDTRLK